MDTLRELFATIFFLDKPITHRPARIAQLTGVGIGAAWLLMLIVHFIAYRNFGTLVLGLVTLVGLIVLWRVIFLMLASAYRWKI